MLAYNEFKLTYSKKFPFNKVLLIYLLTDRWDSLRSQRLEMDGHRCRLCNSPAECVHHRSYPKILGEETVDDLTSLCERCHRKFHGFAVVDDDEVERAISGF